MVYPIGLIEIHLGVLPVPVDFQHQGVVLSVGDMGPLLTKDVSVRVPANQFGTVIKDGCPPSRSSVY